MMLRRWIVTPAALAVLALSSAISATGVDKRAVPSLFHATVKDLSEALDQGLFTSVDLVTAYLGRIDEVNSELRAVTEVNPDALDIAASLDEERRAGEVRGPLHGLPILLKNNIATADKMNNTAGSLALLGATVPRDSHVAAKLKQAGAIILGKANLSQWANYRSNDSSNGWSAHGGQVKGAYIEDQDPSGSSSGCGVAVDLGLAVACIGTETAGSIISPSFANSIVGFKPTVGLVSRDLVIPISQRMDTVGPMVRSVRDAAYLLQATAGPDENDNYTSAIPNGEIPDFLSALDINALKGARIGVASDILAQYAGAGPGTDAEHETFLRALEMLRDEGAEVILNMNFTAPGGRIPSTGGPIAAGDFVPDIASYLSKLVDNPNNVHTLEDLREFTHSTPGEEYPDRNTAEWDAALSLGFDNTDSQYHELLTELRGPDAFGALARRLEEGDGEGLDAILLPSGPSPLYPAYVGSPVVTVPLGYYPKDIEVRKNARGLVVRAPGLPYGLAFLGARFDDAKILGLAYAFEQKTLIRGQVRPYIVPETEIVTGARAGSDPTASTEEKDKSGASTSTKGFLSRCVMGVLACFMLNIV